MKTSKDGLEFIAVWEGCILKPYKDIAGLRTIGIGHLIKPTENFPDGVEITKEKALELLASDVKACEDAINKNIKVELNQNQFDALVSFGFNCGVGVYTTSEACKLLNKGNYVDFPEKILSWSKATINGAKVVVKGLYSRRISEGKLFSTPVDSLENVAMMQWDQQSLKKAQEKLRKLGLYTKSIDGVWGPGTEAALIQFSMQKNMITGPDMSKQVPLELYESLEGS